MQKITTLRNLSCVTLKVGAYDFPCCWLYDKFVLFVTFRHDICVQVALTTFSKKRDPFIETFEKAEDTTFYVPRYQSNKLTD